MAKVLRSNDCGNSPKNHFVQELAVALRTCDLSVISSSLTEDAEWEKLGSQLAEGRETVLQWVDDDTHESLKSLTIHRVVTHGRFGAVDGTARYSTKEIRFADFFEFASAKGTSVRVVTTYQVEL